MANNGSRTKDAAIAVKAYADSIGPGCYEVWETEMIIGDLLCDLLHLLEEVSEGMADPHSAISHAWDCYEEEREEPTEERGDENGIDTKNVR